jgi:hypothetical protein
LFRLFQNNVKPYVKLGLAKLILGLDAYSIDGVGWGIIFATAEDRRVKISFREHNYSMRSIEYYNGSGDADRDAANGPAKIYYDADGSVLGEEYWRSSYLHRPACDGPAVTLYGTDYRREEYWENGLQLFSEPLYSRI